MNDTIDRYAQAISEVTGSNRTYGCTCGGTYIETGGDNYLDKNGDISSYRLYICDRCELAYAVDSNSFRVF